MMLSRVGERVYWMARYLERVENIARLLNVHTALLMDLPIDRGITWYTLVQIFDGEEAFKDAYDVVDESNIMQFLITDTNNSSSLLSALLAARENTRTSLDALPEETWEQVNELYLMTKEALPSINNRYRRQKLMLKIMTRCQTIFGILGNHMSRNTAYDFIQVGKYIERADMTSRTLDMATLLLSDSRSETVKKYEVILWTNLLRALSAHQMYLQDKRVSVKAKKVLNFLVNNDEFPRSLAFSVMAIGTYLQDLPNAGKVLAIQNEMDDKLVDYNEELKNTRDVHLVMEKFQVDMGEIHTAIRDTWFYPDATAE